jgi:hypothetical protein
MAMVLGSCRSNQLDGDAGGSGRRTTVSVAAIVAAALAAAACAAVPPAVFSPRGSAAPVDGNCPTTAAAAFGWGAPNRAGDFTDSSLAGWGIYDGPGHNGNGRRTPSAMSVSDGVLTVTGDAEGNSGGMAWYPGQLHGRWEVCAKAPPSAAGYQVVLLLWPDAGDWPAGGEVDFMEALDPARQNIDFFLHYGPDDSQDHGGINIDATQWHSWAVEWTSEHIAAYVDGKQWWETTNTAHLPPRPMHLAIQLDNSGGDTSLGGQLMVDWARQYET